MGLSNWNRLFGGILHCDSVGIVTNSVGCSQD